MFEYRNGRHLDVCVLPDVAIQVVRDVTRVLRARLALSVQPLCSLCLCGVFLLGIYQPQRHREHGGCTEKSAVWTFRAKLTLDC
jgi:hypothetical protein